MQLGLEKERNESKIKEPNVPESILFAAMVLVIFYSTVSSVVWLVFGGYRGTGASYFLFYTFLLY